MNFCKLSHNLCKLSQNLCKHSHNLCKHSRTLANFGTTDLHEYEISEIVKVDELLEDALVEVVLLPEVVPNGRLVQALPSVQELPKKNKLN
jgi:hypothetical protein